MKEKTEKTAEGEEMKTHTIRIDILNRYKEVESTGFFQGEDRFDAVYVAGECLDGFFLSDKEKKQIEIFKRPTKDENEYWVIDDNEA